MTDLSTVKITDMLNNKMFLITMDKDGTCEDTCYSFKDETCYFSKSSCKHFNKIINYFRRNYEEDFKVPVRISFDETVVGECHLDDDQVAMTVLNNIKFIELVNQTRSSKEINNNKVKK